MATTLAMPTSRATRTIIEAIVVPAEVKLAETVAINPNPADQVISLGDYFMIRRTAIAKQYPSNSPLTRYELQFGYTLSIIP